MMGLYPDCGPCECQSYGVPGYCDKRHRSDVDWGAARVPVAEMVVQVDLDTPAKRLEWLEHQVKHLTQDWFEMDQRLYAMEQESVELNKRLRVLEKDKADRELEALLDASFTPTVGE